VSDLDVTISGLSVYPVKSCGGVALDEVLLVETGFAFDRAWMLVDADGEFVTQRELPRMALVRCALRAQALVLRAPGMLALHLSLDTVEGPARVRLWGEELAAYDMGALAAQWFTDFLRQPLRLVRFDPAQRRLSARAWTGPIEAENAFSDGFPVLVLSEASVEALNGRLAARGAAPVVAARFRPNLLLAGLDAHGEDHLDELAFDTPEGPVRLKLVKPCPRCPIPNVDLDTGMPGTEPLDTLAGYRADARVGGALSFGMNAVIVEGVERVLRVGQAGRATVRF
jgi:uncharacterized protein YcbX